ncbi:hypothetical protein [Cerasicoccus arenae]|uniref:Uncharacterized protein n=1 Tax=Cerasicoccus arenae TaxID=424488 RepID=A0A8J3DBN6_9BACT|nr:hypothetical protein [Cerasicoccus arenae]MBK1858228.1 hypothetical protein [Cerasicoccus arenae]GHC02027.1 hypothetical protein GCM10007047_18150 [Cerasicoccus arenae]
MPLPKKPIAKKFLAKYWDCSAANLSKGKYKNMPKFMTFDEADVWKYDNITNSPARQAAAKESAALRFGNGPGEIPHPSGDRPIVHQSKFDTGQNVAVLLQRLQSDSEREPRDGWDFDERMLVQAEGVVELAYALYQDAIRKGNPAHVAMQLKNWSEASKQAAAIRASFLDLVTRRGGIAEIDGVIDIVSGVLGDLRSRLDKLGDRCAIEANPSDPVLAKNVIDLAINAIFEEFDRAQERIEEDLRQCPDLSQVA